MRNISYIILFIFITGNYLFGQYDESKIKASMVYYFAQYTTWPNEKNIDNYRFGVLSSDTNTYNELKSIASLYRLKNNPITVLTVNENSLPEDIQLLYVGSEYSRKIPRIAERVTGKHILVVSDQCQDGLFSMINLYREKEDKTIAFQINRQNLDSEGFKYSNELLLQGGSLIDLKELYKATSTKLDIELNRLKTIQNQNENLTNETNLLRQGLYTFKSQIDSLSILVLKKESSLSEVIKAIDEKELLFLQKQKELEIKQQELLSLEDSILIRDNLLGERIFEIKALNDSITIKQDLNARKDLELERKDEMIKSRERNTLILLAIVVVFMFAAYLGFRGYRINKVLNIQLEKVVEERTSELEQHKNHLEDLVEERTGEVKKLNLQLGQFNKELLMKNEELYSTNESLLQKTQELEDALKVITETKNQLIQSEKMASLGLLVAGIAHEINNPVNFISAGIQALQRIREQSNQFLNDKLIVTSDQIESNDNSKIVKSEELDEKAQRVIKNMLDGVDRINEIIQSLNNYSRNEGENFREHNIEETIKGTLVILHNKYKGRIQITEEYQNLPLVRCVPGKIGQLFMNLLSNAIDAIPETGEIVIKGTHKPGSAQVVFSIKDTGMGIPEKLHKRIFDPFYTTKEVGKGTGLGLYIAFGIVEQHGGTIEVKSKQGEGTEFVIRLPHNEQAQA